MEFIKKSFSMIKYVDYDIVFQEIPNEVTLAINLSRCPNSCIGCHSPQLRKDFGDELNEKSLSFLFDKYSSDITCVSFMGGDGDLQSLYQLAKFVRKTFPQIKVAWYSGREKMPEDIPLQYFDFIKIGPYMEQYGPLNKKTTNQKLYRVYKDSSSFSIEDITHLFWK